MFSPSYLNNKGRGIRISFLSNKVFFLYVNTLILLILPFLATAQSNTLSGVIYGGGSPMDQAVVSIYNSGSTTQLDSMTTQTNGAYSFTVSNGTYDLRVVPPVDSGFTESVVKDISVQDNNVTQNVVLLAQAVILQGTLYASDGATALPYSDISFNQDSPYYYTNTQTDQNGDFEIALPSGQYQVRVNAHSGSIPQEVDWPEHAEIYLDENFTISQNMTYNFILPPFTRLTGQTRGDGSPLGNVSLQIEGWGNGYTHQYITSDSSGNYQALLPPLSDVNQEYFTIYAYPESGSGYANASWDNLQYSGDTVYNVELSSALTISGYVTVEDSPTSPVVGLELNLEKHNPWLSTNTRTDENGYYEFQVEPGTYNLRGWGHRYEITSHPNWPEQVEYQRLMEDWNITTSENRNFVLPAFTTISGQTLGDGLPQENVYVQCQTNSSDGNSSCNNWTISDSNGNYTLLTTSGTATVDVTPERGSGYAKYRWDNVDFTADRIWDIILPEANIVSGHLALSDGPSSHSLTQFDIHLNRHDPYVDYNFQTNQDGLYQAEVANGNYEMRVWGDQFQLSDPSVWPEWGEIVLPQKEITEHQTYDILIDPFTKVSGFTTDSNGVPVGGIYLRLDSNGDKGNTNDSCHSDANGAYQLLAVPGWMNQEITPPANSGFSSVRLENVQLEDDLLQSIILSLVDTKAPSILSGPYANSVTNTTALIEWRTDEYTKGSVYVGTSTPPTTADPEADYTTAHSHQLTNLIPNTLYYVKVDAYDPAGNGPATSQVITFRTMVDQDTTPPLFISGPTVTSITHDSARVEWETNEPSLVTVHLYGESGHQSFDSAQLSTTGSFHLTGLTPSSAYTVSLQAWDGDNNGPATSHANTFNTLAAPDLQAPVITAGPMVTSVSDSEATIVWTTNEPATSGVSYNDGTSYWVTSDESLVLEHSVTLTGLQAGTEFFYTASSKDGQDNGPTISKTFSFYTLAAPDNNPPVLIEGPYVINVTHQSAVIRWKTDEPSDSLITYGPTEDLGYTEPHLAMRTNHNLTLTGLESNTIYYFKVSSTDSNGNRFESDIYTFQTDSKNDRTAPVVLEGPLVVGLTDTTASLFWRTDEACDSIVNYGVETVSEFRFANAEKVREHRVTLAGLEPNQSYLVEIQSTDGSGNTVTVPLTYTPDDNKQTGNGLTTNADPDVQAPVIIQAPSAIVITNNSAVISWKTDEIADSRAAYGTSPFELRNLVGDPTMVTNHLINLTNLQPSTTYSVQVSSVDVTGNGPTSANILSFTTTSAPDVTAPQIIVPEADQIKTDSATIIWTSDELATSLVEFGLDTQDMYFQSSTDGRTTQHAVVLTNLESSTTYSFKAVSVDSSGNKGESNILTFTTQTKLSSDNWSLYK